MSDLLIKKLSFQKRPIPIPADYRPLYKIALIVLTLKICCRGSSAKLLKLHLFSWALASDQNMTELMDHVVSDFRSEFSVWGIEPALNRALNIAVAEGICEMKSDGKTYRLSKKGEDFYKMLISDKELLEKEKSFLNRIGKSHITDNRLSKMTEKWNLHYA